jgi:uncharacterized membrane protein
VQFAQRFVLFIKATVIGGVFVLAPFVLLVVVIGKALAVMFESIKPVLAWLPVKSVGGVSLALLAAIGALILICFLAGLVAHTAMARWLVRTIESAILANLPGYTLIKSMGEGMAGVDQRDRRQGVLVRYDDHEEIGLVMDRAPDGRLVVFVPNIPSPWSGSLRLVAPERVTSLDVPLRDLLDRLQRMGVGLGDLLPPRER